MPVAYLEASIKAVRSAPWFGPGSTLLCSSDVQDGSRSEAKNWHLLSAGNGFIAHPIVSPSGCRSAKMTFTI